MFTRVILHKELCYIQNVCVQFNAKPGTLRSLRTQGLFIRSLQAYKKLFSKKSGEKLNGIIGKKRFKFSLPGIHKLFERYDTGYAQKAQLFSPNELAKSKFTNLEEQHEKDELPVSVLRQNIQRVKECVGLLISLKRVH